MQSGGCWQQACSVTGCSHLTFGLGAPTWPTSDPNTRVPHLSSQAWKQQFRYMMCATSWCNGRAAAAFGQRHTCVSGRRMQELLRIRPPYFYFRCLSVSLFQTQPVPCHHHASCTRCHHSSLSFSLPARPPLLSDVGSTSQHQTHPLCPYTAAMRLTFGDLLQGSPLATIFSKSKAQACRGGDLGQRIDRNSVDLHKTRLVTRKCSLENSNHGTSPQAHVEELHCVIPRWVLVQQGLGQDSLGPLLPAGLCRGPRSGLPCRAGPNRPPCSSSSSI